LREEKLIFIYCKNPVENKIMEKIVESLKSDFFKTVATLTKKQLEGTLTYLNDKYYNEGLSLISDEDYDRLREMLVKKDANSKVLKNVGAEVTREKVKLPFFMGSMDKIKPDKNNLEAWLKKYKGDVCISDKLDGISALAVKDGPTMRLYTRGDGITGQDITHMIPHIQIGNIPTLGTFAVRGELITTKVNYAKVSEGKRGARQMVSGLANQKKLDKERKALMSLIDFVAYEVIVPEGLTPAQQFTMLAERSSFKVARHEIKKEISIEILSELLAKRKASSLYEIDGIIVAHNAAYPRTKDRNPEHAFAFKMAFAEQQATTQVLKVIWEPSKDGYLKPTVNFEPVNIGGVIIQYATGFNAAFIETNKIGPGAFIEIIRSGDVIPYIKEVKAPAAAAAMPTLAWHWNETHVDAILDDVGDNAEVQKQILLHFAKTMDIAFCGPGNVAKLYDAGIKTPQALVTVKAADLEAKGFAKTSAAKLAEAVATATKTATLAQWATGSGIFGRGLGIKRVEAALKVVPKDYKIEPDLVNKITGQGGWSQDSAIAFVGHLPEFRRFMENVGRKDPVSAPNTKTKSTKLAGQIILFTGFHPKDLEATFIEQGAELADSFVKNLTMLVVKDETVNNAKTQKARAAGIPVKTAEQLKAMI